MNSECSAKGGDHFNLYQLQPVYLGVHALVYAAAYLLVDQYVQRSAIRKLAYLAIALSQVILAVAVQPNGFIFSAFYGLEEFERLYPRSVDCPVRIHSGATGWSTEVSLCQLVNNFRLQFVLRILYWLTVLALIVHGLQVLGISFCFVIDYFPSDRLPFRWLQFQLSDSRSLNVPAHQ